MNPFSFLGKRARASRANERGRALAAVGRAQEAIAEYECSEGRPHDKHEHPNPDVIGQHRVAIAARDSAHVEQLLEDWRPRSGAARVVSIEVVLEAGKART